MSITAAPAAPRPLSLAELEAGFADFICKKHGWLVATFKTATVVCRCGRKATRTRGGVPFRDR